MWLNVGIFINIVAESDSNPCASSRDGLSVVVDWGVGASSWTTAGIWLANFFLLGLPRVGGAGGAQLSLLRSWDALLFASATVWDSEGGGEDAGRTTPPDNSLVTDGDREDETDPEEYLFSIASAWDPRVGGGPSSGGVFLVLAP